jgi:hypothetical protein
VTFVFELQGFPEFSVDELFPDREDEPGNLRMGIFIQPCAFLVSKWPSGDRRPDEEIAHRVCHIFQPAISAPRSAVPEQMQVVDMPRRPLFTGTGEVYPSQPVEGRGVSDLTELDRYFYCGHSALLGREKREWQETRYVLGYFGKRLREAQREYREFVEKGIAIERHPELVGAGGSGASVAGMRSKG